MVDAIEIERFVIASALIGAAAITITCPCGDKVSGRGLLDCHLYEVGALIALATGTIIFANR